MKSRVLLFRNRIKIKSRLNFFKKRLLHFNVIRDADHSCCIKVLVILYRLPIRSSTEKAGRVASHFRQLVQFAE